MPEPPYRALSILLRVFSLLAALGGLLLIFAEKALIVRILLRPPRKRSVHVVPVDAQRNGRHDAHARHTAVVCVTQSRAQRGRRGRAYCRTLHTGADAASFAMVDRHSQYLSGIPLVGAICGAACSGRVALLTAATACALGTYRKFLRRALAAGREMARPDTIALWPDPKQRKR